MEEREISRFMKRLEAIERRDESNKRRRERLLEKFNVTEQDVETMKGKKK